MLNHCHVKMVLDNQAKRSFAQADVNTVIVLFSSPSDDVSGPSENTTRFVMFKVAFEHILSSIIFEEIEATNARKIAPEYRTVPILQSLLLKDGCELGEVGEILETDQGKAKGGPLIKISHYIGNKWGGKYLRAPDIYFTVLDKGARYARCLSEYFEGERYLNTGGADGFFILTGVRPGSHSCFEVSNSSTLSRDGSPFVGEIEKDYLVPLVKDYTKTRQTDRDPWL